MSIDTSIRFVLVRPRTPGNVGSVARAMKNFGFTDLALVDPRLHRAGDRPGEKPVFERESRLTAWGAADLLERARHWGSLDEALEGCGIVLGTAPQPAARVRTLLPEAAAELLLSQPDPLPALVFGSESSGLTSRECARLSGIVVIPTHPAYRDLNLAMSAAIMAYLLYRESGAGPSFAEIIRAPHEDVDAVADGMLDLGLRSEFLQGKEIPVARELRSMLHRVGLTSRETGLLRSLWRRIGHAMSNGIHPEQPR